MLKGFGWELPDGKTGEARYRKKSADSRGPAQDPEAHTEAPLPPQAPVRTLAQAQLIIYPSDFLWRPGH
jgi:hypothetical protein